MVKVIRGSAGVNQRSNCIEMPYIYQTWGRNFWSKCNAFLGSKVTQPTQSRSSWDHFVLKCHMATQFGRMNPWPCRIQSISTVKSHAEVIHGQPEVKLLWKCLMATKFGRKNPDQSILHCWEQRSSRGQPGSIQPGIRKWIACMYVCNLQHLFVPRSFVLRIRTTYY